MGLKDKVVIHLIDDQRTALRRSVHTGIHPAAMRWRAQILIKVDDHGPDGWSDQRIAQALDTSSMTVRRVRQQFAAQGMDATLRREKPSGRQSRKLDSKQEAQLVAIACSPAPQGRSRWTMMHMANRLVELEVVESVDPATGCRTLKKNEIKPWLKQHPRVGTPTRDSSRLAEDYLAKAQANIDLQLQRAVVRQAVNLNEAF